MDATEELLEGSRVAAVVLGMARHGMNLSCKPLDLYNGIVQNLGSQLGPNWPKTISAFGSELRRIAPQLRLRGVAVGFERRGGDRIITLRAEPAGKSGPFTNSPKP